MLGTINPVASIVEKAHAAGAVVVIDGTQAVPQLPVDLKQIDADFYAWTGHKAYGPTGIGVLHGRRELLERHGSKLHASPARLAVAERWFERRGAVTIFFSRWIPVARAAFPYAAGVARMPFARLALLATLGSIPWIAGLAILGREVGRNWVNWRHHLEYVDYLGLALLVLGIAYLILRRARSPKDEPTPDAI